MYFAWRCSPEDENLLLFAETKKKRIAPRLLEFLRQFPKEMYRTQQAFDFADCLSSFPRQSLLWMKRVCVVFSAC